MQYFLECNWVPNRLTRQRKIHGNNTSIFGNRYSENVFHETLSGTTEAQHWPFWPLRQPPVDLHQPQDPLCQPLEALRNLWDPLRHSSSLCMDDAVPLASALSLRGLN